MDDNELSMKYLSDLDGSDKDQKLHSMTKLVDLYSAWIANLKNVAKTLDSRFVSAASKNITECERAAERMYRGIETLKSNENPFAAFDYGFKIGEEMKK